MSLDYNIGDDRSKQDIYKLGDTNTIHFSNADTNDVSHKAIIRSIKKAPVKPLAEKNSSPEEIEKKYNNASDILTSEHIQSLGVSKGIADTIVRECNKAPDFNHCTKSVLGVAAAESGLFKQCSVTKNCHGVMQWVNGKRSLKKFTTYEAGVTDWIRRYIRNERYKRNTEYQWLTKGGYCNPNEGDLCKYWRTHFTSVSIKIDNMF